MPSGSNTGSQNATRDTRSTESPSSGSAATIALTILYHPELARVGDRALLEGLSSRGSVPLSRTELTFAPPRRTAGEPLLDDHLSRIPLHFVATTGGGVKLDVGDSKTAVVVRGQRVRESIAFTPEEIQRGVVIELGHRVVLLLHSVNSVEDVLGGGDDPQWARKLAGESECLRRLLWEIRSVADLTVHVLVRGETGSGKELVADAIHQASSRQKQPFVTVNMGSIPPALVASELFGAEKGAFTGAMKRQGYFGQAHGGTLFLDEIGNAPTELQAALLRVLETGEMQTVGAQQTRKVDARIIAATDADLEGLVAAGTFGAPLLNRIAAYEIWVPPLRQRRDDIGRLLVRFLREEMERIGEAHRLAPSGPGGKPWLPSSLVARLADYDWPRNVRQLRTVVQKLVIGNRGRARAEMTPAIEHQLEDSAPAAPNAPRQTPPDEPELPITTGTPTAAASNPGSPEVESKTKRPRTPPTASRKPADISEEELDRVLRESRWDLAEAAQRLGISRPSMYVLIERYPRFRTAGDLTIDEIRSSYREHGGDVARMADKLEVSERALARRVRELGLK